MSAVGSFNVGRDISLDIVDPVLGPLRFKIRTDFTAEPEYADLKSVALDGVNRYEYLPIGHKLKFTLDRKDSSADSYFAGREAQYFNSQTLSKVTITETIKNTDGTVSIFQYSGCALKMTNRGKWSGDAKVDQTIEGVASRWRQTQ